jgi:hypothetical protein
LPSSQSCKPIFEVEKEVKQDHPDEFYERRLAEVAPNWEEHLGDGALLMTLINSATTGSFKDLARVHVPSPEQRRKLSEAWKLRRAAV